MGIQRKTLALIGAAAEVLAEHHPMTLRQVFYQLVSRQALENTQAAYNALGRALVTARQEGLVPWEQMEDRLRQPRHVSMWADLANFAETAVQAYRRDVWATQPAYLEAWLEKEALAGIFLAELGPYGVTLNVGRGYDGWDSIHNAAERFAGQAAVTVLYFGDFDPSGEDMVRSLRDRLASFDCEAEIVKCALVPEDVERYALPPNPTKRTDTRRARHVAKHGDIAVELDALPVEVLRNRIRAEIEARMDLAALLKVQRREKRDRTALRKALDAKKRSP